MRTLTGALVALALALVAVVGVAGAAWASFRSPVTASASVTTLTLAPPTAAPTVVSCTPSGFFGGDRTLVVSVPDSPTEAVVAARPAGSKVLGYTATATYSAGFLAGSGAVSASVAASGSTTNPLSLSSTGGGARTWSVSVTTTYSGWTSTAVTTTGISC